MSYSFSQTYGPEFVSATFQVGSQFIGQAIIDGISKQFPSRKVQRGDWYADGATNLLQTNLNLNRISPSDQQTIKVLLQSVATQKQQIDDGGGSFLQRMAQARQYKRRSKKLYIVVKRASRRGMQESLLSQMNRAGGNTELGSPNDPFRDQPSAPVFTRSPVDTLNRVELTTFEVEPTGDMPIGLTLHREDGTTEEVLALVQ